MLIDRYSKDPLFSMFGLDSAEYVGAAASGGTVTSIHRKLGDIYEASVKTIFMHALNLTADQVTYSTIIRSGEKEENRSADAYLQFDQLPRNCFSATHDDANVQFQSHLVKVTKSAVRIDEQPPVEIPAWCSRLNLINTTQGVKVVFQTQKQVLDGEKP